MPTVDALIIAAIVLAFIVFGAVLAWADYQTRQARRPADSVSRRWPKNPEQRRRFSRRRPNGRN